MSELALRLDATTRAERARAVRTLLRHPLLSAAEQGRDALEPVARHGAWLTRWFAQHPGWRLVVQPDAGLARLYKVPATGLVAAGRGALHRRASVLLCLVLAVLDDSAGQTTLANLAEAVGRQSREADGVGPFEPAERAERRAFVRALRWAIDRGLLRLRDGDTDRYADSGQADALYDLDAELLARLLGSPQSPALVSGPDRLLDEPGADTDDGRRRASRQQVFRHLLDEPVLYRADLDPEASSWLDRSGGFVVQTLEEVGFLVERRAEGLAAVDPEGLSSDTVFPAGDASHKHAALLVAEQLARRVREGGGDTVSHEELLDLVGALVNDHGPRCHWRRDYLDPPHGTRLLTQDLTTLLVGQGLLRPVPGGWQALPAVARFAPAPPGVLP